MPKIVKSNAVNLQQDVFRVQDITSQRPRPRPKPAPPPEGGAPAPDGAIEDFAQEGFEQPDAACNAGEQAYEYGHPMGEEIVQGAMSEASRILETAIKSAESTRSEMLAKAQFEAEQLRKEAAEQGRRQGFASVVGEVQEIAGRLEKAVAQYEGERAGFEAEFEEHLKWLAVEIASKVLAKRISEDDTEMADMVAKAVQAVQNEPWIRVEVSNEMTGLIDRLTGLFQNSGNVKVNGAATAPGTVHIETPSGVVDASLLTQLENMKQYFQQK